MQFPFTIFEKVLFIGGGRFYFYFLNLFIYLFMATLGLPCRVRAFSSCSERGLLFVAVCGLLITLASLVEDHGL